MYRRLQSLIRTSSGTTVDASDLDDIHTYIAQLTPVFRDALTNCQVSFAVLELCNNTSFVGQLIWDGDVRQIRFKPAQPDDTQPLSVPIQN